MARYYFDYVCDGDTACDKIGLEFVSLEDARAAALEALTEWAKELVPYEVIDEMQIVVRDERDQNVLSASLVLNVELTDSQHRRR